MNIHDLKRKIRANLFFRVLFYPYMVLKKKMQYDTYIKSEDSVKLQKFKGCNKGKRCFLIGNGPSLLVEDLDKLQGELCLAGNRIFDLFEETKWRPEYYFMIDNDACDYLNDACCLDVPNKFITLEAQSEKYKSEENLYFINCTGKRFVINRYNDKKSHISEDVSKYFCSGYTVLFTALQFAIYTGIKEIYLLGVDFNYVNVSDKMGRIKTNYDLKSSHFKGEQGGYSYLNYWSVLYAWQNAKKYADENGIKIYDATRNGKLTVFEKVDFNELMGKC